MSDGTQSVLTVHEQTASLCELAALLAQRGWLPATSGNLSVLAGQSPLRFLITRSGADKQTLQARDVVVAGEQGGLVAAQEESLRPSAEAIVHAGLYEKLSIGCILHVHTVANNLCSELGFAKRHVVLRDQELLKALGHWEPEASVSVPVVPNCDDLEELADVVQTSARPDVPGVLVKNHGIYAWGQDATAARRHLEAFEFLFAHLVQRRMLGLLD